MESIVLYNFFIGICLLYITFILINIYCILIDIKKILKNKQKDTNECYYNTTGMCLQVEINDARNKTRS